MTERELIAPLDDDAGIVKLEHRLGILVRHFKELAPGMSDLPLYNHKVGVEAVDFLPFAEMGLGALVTPWFINLVFLPLDAVPYAAEKVGLASTIELPAGQRTFVLGGDELTGLFWSYSIVSPLAETLDHDRAVDVARAGLTQVLTKPGNEPVPDGSQKTRSRREIIFGTPADPVTV